MERIVFGDPSDIINNLSNDEDVSESNINKTINNDTLEANDVNDDLNTQSDGVIYTEDQKKVAWIDEDDAQYSYV